MDVFNHSICTACRGLCCKTMPGPTTPEDWGPPESMRDRITAAPSLMLLGVGGCGGGFEQ